MKYLKSMLVGWTPFEIGWLLSFLAINLYLFFAWQDSFIGLVSSLTGMLCVVLVAKGKIANYYFGMVQILTYSYISYSYGLFGEVLLNMAVYLPLQFIGLYWWTKNARQVKEGIADIKAKRLTIKQWSVVTPLLLVALMVLVPLLYVAGGKYIGIDSVTTVLSVFAQVLMIKRYAEQWLLWIVVNVLSIIMWAYALTTSGGNDWTILVMWVAFLLNSVYGYINWLKLSKESV